MSIVDDRIFKALGDGRRRKILDLLQDGPLTTGELCSRFRKLDRCTVMQHIAVLQKAKLIVVERRGRFRLNFINTGPIKAVTKRWLNDLGRGALKGRYV